MAIRLMFTFSNREPDRFTSLKSDPDRFVSRNSDPDMFTCWANCRPPLIVGSILGSFISTYQNILPLLFKRQDGSLRLPRLCASPSRFACAPMASEVHAPSSSASIYEWPL